MGPTGGTPATTLLCLYADEVVERDDWKSKGVQVPGREVKVKTSPLAALVCAWALWSLEQEGALRLTLEEKKRLGIRTRKVVVEPAAREALLAPRPPGIVSELAAVVAAAGRQDADDVVRTWLRHDVPDPHGTVVARAVAEGVASGALGEVDAGRSGVAAMVRGRTEVVRRAEGETERQAEFARLLSTWRAFESERGGLADALVTKCRRGLDSRVEATDHDYD